MIVVYLPELDNIYEVLDFSRGWLLLASDEIDGIYLFRKNWLSESDSSVILLRHSYGELR